jgi:hypothetical protein
MTYLIAIQHDVPARHPTSGSGQAAVGWRWFQARCSS